MGSRFALALACLAAMGLGVVLAPGAGEPELDPAVAKKLQQVRNLGKAFYENPGSQQLAVEQLAKAVELNPGAPRDILNYGLALLRAGQAEEGIAQLQKAQKLDPELPHTYFNLGIEFKRRGEVDRALEQMEQMAKLVPHEAKAHYNLGVLYKQKDEIDKALESFERAAELDPSLAAPHFQMFGLLRRRDPVRAKQELAEFQRLKAAQGEGSSEDVDWSFYSELHDPIQAGPPPEEAAKTVFRALESWPLEGEPRGLLLLEADGDRRPDVVAWTDRRFVLLPSTSYTLETGGPESRHVAAGDYNNDGFHDLLLVGASRVLLITLEAGESRQEPKRLATGDFQAAAWVDYDHDYDLDAILVGRDHALLRNNGDGTFLDVSDEFPFQRDSHGLAVTSLELEEDDGNDIVIAYDDGVVVYEDHKLGRYEARPIKGVQTASGGMPLRFHVADWNNDGFLDLALTPVDPSGAATQILVNDQGELSAGPKLPQIVGFIDAQNRGWLDGIGGGKLWLNQGDFEFEPKPVEGLPDGRIVATEDVDLDGDGKNDLVALDAGGRVRRLINETPVENAYVTVSLEGTKNFKLAQGARVEVKAGLTYGKQIYQGVPLTFGMGKAESVDTIRVTWPNGMIQNESQQDVNTAHHYVEKPRLSGSCPMIFTWNGREFEFISEVLGVAPLGASMGGGKFFPVDHDEYVLIPGSRLLPRDGMYEVRITEELREVAYLDQIRLLAVDHPADLDIFTNEKFKGPPFPSFRLFGVSERQHPASAVDRRGHDVLARIRHRDRRYVDDFQRDFAGRAETHSLTLDFPALAGRDDIVLFLNGWVDWADASTFVRTSQSPSNRMFGPYLEVRDSDGEWVKVMADMGLPAGRPRTIAVDLGGKFPSESREIRITTNICIYWDEVFAGVETKDPPVTLAEASMADADLRFRGFSDLKVHPERKQPEEYNYARVSPTSMWNPAPGAYTRFGDVRPLLRKIDDRLVVMGSGDELALRFSGRDLPALRSGWARDFLLFVDGWAKETEANTAFGDRVEPLPFHAMNGYPYDPDRGHPKNQEHRAYQREYNTRQALRLIRPLRLP